MASRNRSKTLFLHLLFYMASTSAEETYENSTNICQRCSCNDAQIFELDCSNQSLTLMLANWPTQKPIRATFTGNNFTKLEKLPPTESSVEIVLSKCNIQSLDPAVFNTATKTKLVDLSYNLLVSEEVTSDKFRGPIKDSRSQPIGIEDLNLAYNQIHSLNKDVFEFLPNLTRLNLEGNDFRVLDAHTQLALANVPGLTSLNLANNELTDLIPDAIEKLTKLVELDLSKNDLDFVPYSLEEVGTSLEVLIVDDNPIFEMTEKTFSKLPNIVEISANNLTLLTRINASTFASNLKLTKLSLRNNTALHAIDPAAFSPQSTLKELHLDNANLTDLPVGLLNWTSLDSLTLHGTNLTCTCDLHHIFAATPNEDPPTCADPSSPARHHIPLTSDVCEVKQIVRIRYQHISIPLAGLIVTLFVAILAAIAMAYSRYRRFVQQSRQTPFASQVMYSPLLAAYSR
ncbi:leucine-rich repeat-containing protein 70-like isoform X1 [Zophobas morio]|uniref:leucine-rich repeat-containing protein 70-like isoform X1 n=2 Tax=Zophobas morio TaxID=2755281 RepID=UPI003083D958